MRIKNFYPQNEILKAHIEYYYFLKTGSKNFHTAYYSFPNTNHSFNIHKNVSCEILPSSTSVFGDNKNKYLTIVQGRYQSPLLVRLQGEIDKITIIFKPLGINHFIDKPFASIANQHSQIFTEWQDDPNFEFFLEKFYNTVDNNRRIKQLENFLLLKYRHCSYNSILEKAIEQLTDFDIENSINEIAEGLCMNTRSFNRLFYNQLGISPASFRKIARFRHSLKNMIINRQFKKLTEIGYESNFYDQSYFIKIYKKLTKATPSTFYQSIDKLANDLLILKFIPQ